MTDHLAEGYAPAPTVEAARAFFDEPVPERMTDERLDAMDRMRPVSIDFDPSGMWEELLDALLTERKHADKAHEAGKVLAGRLALADELAAAVDYLLDHLPRGGETPGEDELVAAFDAYQGKEER